MQPKDQFILNAAAKAYQGPSVVDFLSKAGYDSSIGSRTALGQKYGVTGTPGSADYNTRLLNTLRAGQAESTTANGSASNVGSMGMSDPAQAPAAPVQSAEDLAFESYIKALTPSAETTAAREFLARSIRDSKMAQERALNSGETMGFASGEAQRVNRNNDLTLSAIKDSYDALREGDQSNQSIAKIKYDYTKSKAENAKQAAKDLAEANKPFKLSQGESQYVWDPATRTYKIVAAMAAKPTSTGGGQKDLTYAQQKEADLTARIANVTNQFKQLLQSKPEWYGVPEDIYREEMSSLSDIYGQSAVADFEKAFKAKGLRLDKGSDGKKGDEINVGAEEGLKILK